MIGDVFLDAVSIDAEALKRVERGLQIYILLEDLLGIYNDVIDQLAVREHCTLAVQDPAPLKGDRLVLIGLLRQHLHGICLPVIPVNEEKPYS